MQERSPGDPAERRREHEETLRELERTWRELRHGLNVLRTCALERRHREHASAFWGRAVHRPRLVSEERLADLLDDAVDAGLLTLEELCDVLLASFVVKGRRRSDGVEAYVVVEVAVCIGLEDVERVIRLAAVLGRLAPTLAAVAGDRITPEAAAFAAARGVGCVVDEQVVVPIGG